MSKKNKHQRYTDDESIPTIQVGEVAVSASAMEAYGGLSPTVIAYVTNLNNYCNAMAPGMPMSVAEGANWNTRLYNNIINVLELKNIADFFSAMDEYMRIFQRESQGALNLTYTQRFIDKMMLNPQQLATYAALCDILVTFSDPNTRQRYGEHYDLVRDLRYVSPEARERFIGYLKR